MIVVIDFLNFFSIKFLNKYLDIKKQTKAPNEEAKDASSASDERKKEIKNNLLSAGKILGILEDDPGNWLGYNQKDTENTEEIERLINERNEARRSKNFNLADTIRDTLKDKGIEIEDTDKGTIWRKSR